MDTKITEEGIMEVKALTMSRGIFKQCRNIVQKEFSEYILAEDIDPANLANWLGYTIESWEGSIGTMQSTWFLFMYKGTMCKIRDTELFLLLRVGSGSERPTDALRDLLPQVFIKG